MSIIPPSLSRLLQFYLSGPLPCPYLPGQVERKLFTRLADDEAVNTEINAMLTRAGFRRSHDIVYRPACPACNACVPVRIPARLFAPSRSLKRIAARNRDLTLEIAGAKASDELYNLFLAYQRARHADSDMALMSQPDFALMLGEGKAETRLYGLRDARGVLLGCMIADLVGDGLSAVYSFFTPDESRRSLGAQLVLDLIDEARKENLTYVYLGYWIAEARKMSYKKRFQPLQALGPDGWNWLDPAAE
jgi:arginyl-tRNA--protein-N-Asp/Glu arginylyltransferase